jgi:hypothetical protein
MTIVLEARRANYVFISILILKSMDLFLNFDILQDEKNQIMTTSVWLHQVLF